MTMIDFQTGGNLEALARGRYVLMQRASTLMQVGEPAAVDALDKVTALSGLLVTSLEELKVAEEELREQNAALLQQREENEERTRHYRQMFLHAPVPVVVTDIFGTISEVNLAASQLLRRAADALKRKPLAALIPNEEREEFRRRLRRLLDDDGPKEWGLVLVRSGDTPLTVRATVTRVPEIGPTHSGMLLWFVSPSGQEEASESTAS
jgi:PAS domain S-box-containing protein